jgi:hypothetical protein
VPDVDSYSWFRVEKFRLEELVQKVTWKGRVIAVRTIRQA